MKTLEKQCAVVTGGARGIGRAICLQLAERGANIYVTDMLADELNETVALCRERGVGAACEVADITKPGAVEHVIEAAVEKFGQLDIMVNNAGISQKPVARFLDDDLSDFERVMAVNLKGVMLGSQRAGRYMKEHGGGVIINNASMGGVVPGFAIQMYRASKAAVIHFTKGIAIDLAEYGIRVNCISPGLIETRLITFAEPGMTQDDIDRINRAVVPAKFESQPLKREGKPEDVANAVVFLASKKAAQITGINMSIDGGHSTGDPINHLAAIMSARAEALKGG